MATDNFDYEAWEDKITAYLNGSMSPEDHAVFEKNMAENTDLAEAVSFDKTLNQQAKANLLFQHLVPQMNDFVIENKLESKPTSPRTPLSIKTILGGLSLILLVILGGFWVYQAQRSAKYATIVQKWTLTDPMPYVGNDTLFRTDATAEAIKAYQRGNYQQAETYFLQDDSRENNQQNSRLYRAITAIMVQPPNTDKAIQLLEERYGDNQRFGYQAIEWYLALAYLQKKDVAKAFKILKEIPNNSEYASKAKAMMDELTQNGFSLK